MLKTVTIEDQAAQAERLEPLHPVGAVAALILRRRAKSGRRPLLYIAQTQRRARKIQRLLEVLDPGVVSAFFPQWDGFPSDGVPPTVEAVGGRMSVLRWLTDAKNRPTIVVTTPDALLRRVLPRSAWDGTHLEFRPGDTIDVEATGRQLERLGYRLDERVDEPGEASIRGRVVEFFPAAAPRPCRIEHEKGRITAIRSFDPATQRSVAVSEQLIVDPASELVARDRASGAAIGVAIEAYHGRAESFFDYLDDAEIVLEAGAETRGASLLAVDADEAETTGIPANRLTAQEWRSAVAPKLAAVVAEASGDDADSHVPVFAREGDPLAAARTFLGPLREKGWRVVLAGPEGDALARWSRRLGRALDTRTASIDAYAGVRKAKAGTVFRLAVPLDEGFLSHGERIAVVALRDLAGQRMAQATSHAAGKGFAGIESFGIGDAVVHFDHGVAILDGLETVGEGKEAREVLRLRYEGGATLLVPLEEIDALWHYGGGEANVRLDKLRGEAWTSRRNRTVMEIAGTAERMVELLKARETSRSEALTPDRSRYERFCARFPYELTDGQTAALDAVLADLAAKRPMDRLLCGDVGFGKTEVALRAAAASAFAGRQVAVVAPTTVLALQHFKTFEKRFARLGVRVALLSRLQSAKEKTAIKAALAGGEIDVLVGTHAVCAKGVGFERLALVVIDEEQRFGAKQKEALRALAPGLNVLSMTATPIPRTLQAGFVGLHDLSVIATPPTRRRPVLTRLAPFDGGAVKDALAAEKARGGQSFVVCPRIEDLDPVGEAIADMLPDLRIVRLHGEMPAATVDDAMIAFAEGSGDVLLATNIVESGIDVPTANTIVVCRPERFGLAQLHQLRGRVGRGTQRGVAILATASDADIPESARHRLETLERLNALGSGFDISARDLDLRGAGELIGEEQAGHLNLVGLSLYRRTLERALAAARGENLPDDWRTDLNLGFDGRIPVDYIAEPELRIELASALARVDDEASLGTLMRDVADRFGALPDALKASFDLAALRLHARALGVRRLDAGPKGAAATFAKADAEALRERVRPKAGEPLRWSDLRLVLDEPSDGAAGRLATVERLLDRIG